MCLPCQVGDGTMVRHCVLCERCLKQLITDATNLGERGAKYIVCPVCHQQFNHVELMKVWQDLAFPSGKPSAQEYDGYDVAEETYRPYKQRRLETLRHAPSSVFSPDFINWYKEEYFKKIESKSSTIGQNGLDHVQMLMKRSDVFDIEKVRVGWNLEYKGSAVSDPFPKNIDAILVGCLLKLEQTPAHATVAHLGGTFHRT